MTEFTFITANDIHISDHPPRSRIDNFKNTVLGKIEQIGQACSKLKADGVLLAGDLFNIKDPAKNSHALNQDLIRVFKKFPCPIFTVEGNHDIVANRVESISEQPLGVLFEDGTLIRLRERVIEKDGIKVSLVGIPYAENIELDSLKIPSREGCVTQICVMHQYAGLKGGMLFKYRLYGYDELAKLGPDIFVLGHYHLDQGIYEQDGRYFINLGSVTRGVLSEDDIEHHPQIGLIKIVVDKDIPKYSIIPVRLRISPASEVFDLEKKKEEVKENKEMMEFIEKLSTEVINSSKDTSKTIDDVIDSMDLAKIIRDRVVDFIRIAVDIKAKRSVGLAK